MSSESFSCISRRRTSIGSPFCVSIQPNPKVSNFEFRISNFPKIPYPILPIPGSMPKTTMNEYYHLRTVMVIDIDDFNCLVVNHKNNSVLLVQSKGIDSQAFWLQSFSMKRRVTRISHKKTKLFIKSSL